VAVAKRYIQLGIYKNVLIVSGDLLSHFVLTGFQSFQALSPQACKPYDADRQGINLGEAIGSVLVCSESRYFNEETVEVIGEGSANDANHISGPSRTGEGLYQSIQRALTEAQITPSAIDYLSAHGTATLYNDEMEAIAFDRAGLSSCPVNSLKAYFRHSLG